MTCTKISNVYGMQKPLSKPERNFFDSSRNCEEWGWEGNGRDRRKIRMIESDAKCRNLKTFTCKGTLRQVFSSV
jgi:hypothetical protein